MKISVIVSAYNMADYLDKSITSVISQSYKDFELILINDGSTDDTDLVCSKWSKADDRIRYISKENEGLSASRNMGIRMADGEYVTFLDADDWFADDYLKKFADSAKDFNSDVVIGDVRFVEDMGGEFRETDSIVRLSAGKVTPEKETNFFGKCRTFMWGKLYRKSLFDDNTAWLPDHNFEDISVTSYLIHKGDVVSYAPGAFYCYLRNRNGSITNDFRQLRFTRVSMEELLERFERDGSYERNKKALKHLYWGQVCHIFNVTKGKFSKEGEKDIEEVRKDIFDVFMKRFPEEEALSSRKYFVGNDKLLESAIRHIILDESQIVSTPEKAECVVEYGSESSTKDASGYMHIKLKRKEETTDAATDTWNLTDEILDVIFE